MLALFSVAKRKMVTKQVAKRTVKCREIVKHQRSF